MARQLERDLVVARRQEQAGRGAPPRAAVDQDGGIWRSAGDEQRDAEGFVRCLTCAGEDAAPNDDQTKADDESPAAGTAECVAQIGAGGRLEVKREGQVHGANLLDRCRSQAPT